MNDRNEERKERVIPMLAIYMVIAGIFILLLGVRIIHAFRIHR